MGVNRGYKQSPEYIAKRIKSGPEHQNWIGDAVSTKGGRTRALRMYEARNCEDCGSSRAERHHVNEDTSDNSPGNIKFLCRRCHMMEDGRLAAFILMAKARSVEVIAIAAAIRRARTTCKRDHPLSGDNLYVTPSGCARSAERSILRPMSTERKGRGNAGSRPVGNR